MVKIVDAYGRELPRAKERPLYRKVRGSFCFFFSFSFLLHGDVSAHFHEQDPSPG